jgi:hypothetical protein
VVAGRGGRAAGARRIAGWVPGVVAAGVGGDQHPTVRDPDQPAVQGDLDQLPGQPPAGEVPHPARLIRPLAARGRAVPPRFTVSRAAVVVLLPSWRSDS